MKKFYPKKPEPIWLCEKCFTVLPDGETWIAHVKKHKEAHDSVEA